MADMDFKKVRSVFFFGVGGIGVSAIARMVISRGAAVSGSDAADSSVIADLQKLGAEISIGQSLDSVPKNADLIVYSAALEVADPAFVAEIKKLGIPAINYSEALGLVTKDAFTIAVSGTHGKTTTTAMIAEILMHAGRNPSVIVGSLLNRTRSNFVAGREDLIVVEADEYRRSFLSLSPKILVITNIDRDHLDYYKDLTDIQSAFLALAKKVPPGGFVVLDAKNKNVEFLLDGLDCVVIDYSKIDASKLCLPIPGAHNLENAKAALAVGTLLGIKESVMFEAFAIFGGTARRFEFKGKTRNGAFVYDDYAHNPPKVKAAILGAREKYPKGRLMVLFQPHLFSRTKLLFDDFAHAFGEADEVLLLPIYPAREAFDSSISSDLLATAIVKNGTPARLVKSLEEAADELSSSAKTGDVLLVMGAGDVTKVADILLGYNT